MATALDRSTLERAARASAPGRSSSALAVSLTALAFLTSSVLTVVLPVCATGAVAAVTFVLGLVLSSSEVRWLDAGRAWALQARLRACLCCGKPWPGSEPARCADCGLSRQEQLAVFESETATLTGGLGRAALAGTLLYPSYYLAGLAYSTEGFAAVVLALVALCLFVVPVWFLWALLRFWWRDRRSTRVRGRHHWSSVHGASFAALEGDFTAPEERLAGECRQTLAPDLEGAQAPLSPEEEGLARLARRLGIGLRRQRVVRWTVHQEERAAQHGGDYRHNASETATRRERAESTQWFLEGSRVALERLFEQLALGGFEGDEWSRRSSVRVNWVSLRSVLEELARNPAAGRAARAASGQGEALAEEARAALRQSGRKVRVEFATSPAGGADEEGEGATGARRRGGVA